MKQLWFYTQPSTNDLRKQITWIRKRKPNGEPRDIEQDQAEIREMLDYWYSKANDNTKAEFKQSIN